MGAVKSKRHFHIPKNTSIVSSLPPNTRTEGEKMSARIPSSSRDANRIQYFQDLAMCGNESNGG